LLISHPGKYGEFWPLFWHIEPVVGGNSSKTSWIALKRRRIAAR
jgi:hypothetical protein